MEVPEASFRKGRLSKFYKSNMLTDCTFIVNGMELRMHRFILACSSQVFERMLFGDFASDVIEIPDVELNDFKEVMDFIYLNILELKSISHAWNLFVIGNRFFIEDLNRICLSYISRNVGVEKVLLSYEYCEMYNLPELQEKCLSIMENYFPAVFLAEYHMKPTTFSAVMDRFRPKVDLYDLAISIVDWAFLECDFRELPFKCENILQILKDVNASQCLGQAWLKIKYCPDCKNELKLCTCLGEVMHQSIVNLYTIIEDRDPDLSIHKHFFWLKIPKKCKLRDEFKIATRIDLENKEEFVTRFISDHKIVVLGLVIVTPMKPINIESNCFNGTVVVRICGQYENINLCKPSVFKGTIFYDCCIYLPLRDLLILDANRVHDFRISYNTFDKTVISVPAYYFSHTVTNDGVNVTFYDDFGSVLKGVTFCKA